METSLFSDTTQLKKEALRTPYASRIGIPSLL